MFCWEAWGPGILLDIIMTPATCLNIAVSQEKEPRFLNKPPNYEDPDPMSLLLNSISLL